MNFSYSKDSGLIDMDDLILMDDEHLFGVIKKDVDDVSHVKGAKVDKKCYYSGIIAGIFIISN